MKKYYQLYISILLIVINISILNATSANDINFSNNNWLHGSWILTYDPDNEPKDQITFKTTGNFTDTQISTGITLEGKYILKKNIIELTLIQGGQILSKLKLTYNSKKDKLYYKSEPDGVTSYYTKVYK